MIKSMSLKSLKNINFLQPSNRHVILVFWLENYFGFSSFGSFLNILMCRLNPPLSRNWRGCPFYLGALHCLSSLINKPLSNIECILSTPIWHNKSLKTKFDKTLAEAGFLTISDLFFNSTLIKAESINLPQRIKRKVLTITNRVPECWKNIVLEHNIVHVSKPTLLVKFGEIFRHPLDCTTKIIYKKIIECKTSTPKGLLNWLEDIDIEESQLKLACIFTNFCTKDIFRQVFQFKINCQILPTNSYLKQYKVLDNDRCPTCGESETVLHRTWECREIASFIEKVFDFLNSECGTILSLEDSRNEYLFGLPAENFPALNQILLELKVFNFYSLPKDANLGHPILLKMFFSRLRKIILQEKCIGIFKKSYEEFEFKWEKFIAIYDFRGPDFDQL